ncbi:unnamed protein product [Rotaria sp. Silwood1]|nr:unnamed protein product [Rotaria sp. Silwood1]
MEAATTTYQLHQKAPNKSARRQKEVNEPIMGELSIQYIDIIRLKRIIAREITIETTTIEQWLQAYLRRRRTEKSDFQPIATPLWDPKDNNGYEMRVYFCSQSVESTMAQFIQKFRTEEIKTSTELTEKKLVFILFFYRSTIKHSVEQFHRHYCRAEDSTITSKDDGITTSNCSSEWEIFALTTGWAWEVLQGIVDYNFPIRIAKRLLDPKTIKKHDVKPLHGPIAKSSKIYASSGQISKQGAVENEHILVQTSLRKNCSLETIFDKLANVQLAIHKRLIRFLTKTIPQEKYFDLLNHLSTIARQGDTYMKTSDSCKHSNSTELSPQAELDLAAFDFLDDLQKAKPEDSAKMNRWIYLQMSEYCQRRQQYLTVSTNQESDNALSTIADLPISLCHKYVEDFYDASEITVKIHSEKTLSMPISISAVLDAFLNDSIKAQINVVYETALQNVEISFTRKNGQPVKEPLINYIEAEYYDAESGRHFIRKGNMCYELSADYLKRIQENFMSTLRDIKESDAYKYHESITRDQKDEKFWPKDFQQLISEMNEKQKKLFELTKQKNPVNTVRDNENNEDAYNENEDSAVPTSSVSAKVATSHKKPPEERETIFNMTYLGMEDHFLGDKVSITYRPAWPKETLQV